MYAKIDFNDFIRKVILKSVISRPKIKKIVVMINYSIHNYKKEYIDMKNSKTDLEWKRSDPSERSWGKVA